MGTLTLTATTAERFWPAIADALVESAIVASSGATWLAPTLAWANGAFELVDRTGDVTLYDGSAGIAIACAVVGVSAGRADLVDVAIRGARHAVAGSRRVAEVGLYDGLAGIGLAALAVGHRVGDQELCRSGTAILDEVKLRPPAGNDLIGGLAGTALAFVRAAALTGDERWVSAARSTADSLVARAEQLPWGWAWPSAGDQPALCGLAHGAAGPAWVLSEVAAACGEGGAFTDAIDGARQYERSWFDPRTNLWPDLREWTDRQEAPPQPSLWCHGSVGIGLSRLGMHARCGHPALAAEAAAALQSSCAAAVNELDAGTLDRGLTVCHGLGGTVDLLIDAHMVFGEDAHLETSRWIVDRAVDVLGEDVESWAGGVRGRPGPGLMNGLAGTMAVLARVADPTLPGIGLLGIS